MTLATRVCELSEWESDRELVVLAAAYAEVGDFDSAVKYQLLALKIMALKKFKPSSSEFAEQNRRLELYRHQKPFAEH